MTIYVWHHGNHIPPSLAHHRLGKQSTQLSIRTQEDNEEARGVGITLNDSLIISMSPEAVMVVVVGVVVVVGKRDREEEKEERRRDRIERQRGDYRRSP